VVLIMMMALSIMSFALITASIAMTSMVQRQMTLVQVHNQIDSELNKVITIILKGVQSDHGNSMVGDDAISWVITPCKRENKPRLEWISVTVIVASATKLTRIALIDPKTGQILSLTQKPS
jgi:cell division protein FtsI/penicillin-binding protein 2